MANKILRSNFSVSGNVSSDAFIVVGGTSSQFLKGDGTLDSNTYVLSGDSRLSDTRTPTDGTVTRAKLATALNGYVNLGNVSGVVNIDCSLGVHYRLNLTAAITSLTFSGYATEHLKTITLEIIANGFTCTFPSTILTGDDWTNYDSAKTNQVQCYLYDVTTPKFSNGLLPL